MEIVKATIKDALIIADIISESNKDVAVEFGINSKNNPKHPSFCTKDWIMSDFEKNNEYFLYQDKSKIIGCVSFQIAGKDKAYLNRLAVLPNHQKKGVGKLLVNHVIAYAKLKNIPIISIGIIAEHKTLKNWYLKLGFIAGDVKEIEHLPFDVLFMQYIIMKEHGV